MAVIEILVGDDGVTLNVPNAGWSARLANAVVLQRREDGDREFLGVGGQGEASDPRRQPGAREVSALVVGGFDPAVAAAYVRFLVAQGLASHLELSKPNVRLTWADWDQLPRDARTAFLRAVMSFAADVQVNGRLTAKNSFWRQVLTLRPVIEP